MRDNKNYYLWSLEQEKRYMRKQMITAFVFLFIGILGGVVIGITVAAFLK